MAAVESQLKPNVGTEARSWSRLKCNLETEISVDGGTDGIVK